MAASPNAPRPFAELRAEAQTVAEICMQARRLALRWAEQNTLPQEYLTSWANDPPTLTGKCLAFASRLAGLWAGGGTPRVNAAQLLPGCPPRPPPGGCGPPVPAPAKTPGRAPARRALPPAPGFGGDQRLAMSTWPAANPPPPAAVARPGRGGARVRDGSSRRAGCLALRRQRGPHPRRLSPSPSLFGSPP